MKSRRMVLGRFSSPLSLESWEVPEPKGEEVIVRVRGAGVCRTDLRIWKGTEAKPGFHLPLVLGHEIAGTVEDFGEAVTGLKKGEGVLVYSAWTDGTCRFCRRGLYNICPHQVIPGQTTDGGFAEHVVVPSHRWLVKLGDVSPVDAAPLADAGTTSMGAVRMTLPYLWVGSVVVVNGIGGIGPYTVQLLKVLAPTSVVVAISRSEVHRELALKAGADHAFSPSEAIEEVRRLSGGEGAAAAIDLVGTEETTKLLSSLISIDGAIVLVGMEGRNVSLPTFETAVWNRKLLGSNYGTMNDMSDVVRLMAEGKLMPFVVRRNLEEANEALLDLDSGRVVGGRQVLTP